MVQVELYRYSTYMQHNTAGLFASDMVEDVEGAASGGEGSPEVEGEI